MKCSICGKEIKEKRKNAYLTNDGRCCDVCTAKFVIKARLAQLVKAKKIKK